MGTTLEILAHYLAHDIKVYSLEKNKQFPLLALSRKHNSVQIIEKGSYVEPEMLLPVLRPFSALTTPLPDGTIPAVEALRMACDWPSSFYRHRFTARLMSPNCVRVESYSDLSGGWIRLEEDYGRWVFDPFDDGKMPRVTAPLEAYDYLRRHHFAVGLTPDQFIPKI